MDKDIEKIFKQLEQLKDIQARTKYYRDEIDEVLMDNWLENHPVELKECEVIVLDNILHLQRKKR